MKIEVEHPVPGLDNLVVRLEKQRPSNWDIPASSEKHIEEIGVADYIWAALVDLAVVVGVDLALERPHFNN